MFHLWLDIEEFQPGELVLFRLSSSAYLGPEANALIKDIPRIANVFLFIVNICGVFKSKCTQRLSAGSTNCGILPLRMGEHEDCGDHGEHGKDWKHQPDGLKTQIIKMFTMIMMVLSSWQLLKWDKNLSGNVPQPILVLLASTNPGFGLGSLAWNCPDVLHGSLGIKIRKFFKLTCGTSQWSRIHTRLFRLWPSFWSSDLKCVGRLKGLSIKFNREISKSKLMFGVEYQHTWNYNFSNNCCLLQHDRNIMDG